MTIPRLFDSSALHETFAEQHRTHQPLDHVVSSILVQFSEVMRSYIYFNIFFLTIGCIEFFLLIVFFTFLMQSAILALSLALLFLTFFSYFTLKLYFQTRKTEQLQELKERYLTACKAILHYQDGVPEHHIALANACTMLSDRLQGSEYDLYPPPEKLNFLSPSLRKFSYWCHWWDVHRIRELILHCAIEENIKLVKCGPTSLEAHAALANAYVLLSSLYADPCFIAKEGWGWISHDKSMQMLDGKFRATAERAIEEFKILNDFAPNDPWIHIQLAYSYHDLNMPMEEIREYETVMTLNPEDTESLFKLGKLYFEQGLNAKGLRIYEQLKHIQPQKADALIHSYGAYHLCIHN